MKMKYTFLGFTAMALLLGVSVHAYAQSNASSTTTSRNTIGNIVNHNAAGTPAADTSRAPINLRPTSGAASSSKTNQIKRPTAAQRPVVQQPVAQRPGAASSASAAAQNRPGTMLGVTPRPGVSASGATVGTAVSRPLNMQSGTSAQEYNRNLEKQRKAVKSSIDSPFPNSFGGGFALISVAERQAVQEKTRAREEQHMRETNERLHENSNASSGNTARDRKNDSSIVPAAVPRQEYSLPTENKGHSGNSAYNVSPANQKTTGNAPAAIDLRSRR